MIMKISNIIPKKILRAKLAEAVDIFGANLKDETIGEDTLKRDYARVLGMAYNMDLVVDADLTCEIAGKVVKELLAPIMEIGVDVTVNGK